MDKYTELNKEIWIKVKVESEDMLRDWVDDYQKDLFIKDTVAFRLANKTMRYEYEEGRGFQLIYFLSPMDAYLFGLFSADYLKARK